ncbi:MAG: metallophosphoesterase [Candidatus Heimdallarchaeota archaeon]|nr:metallophosphoesterase [Candidatus Heimdallarchaeota archaeon]MCK4955216.1 metallophosphoesterase [Candidatus Heimdallarchaeota archaeon]
MKKSIRVILLLLVLSAQIVFINDHSVQVSSLDQEQYELINLKDSINATSSTDFFNESKHPRYPLVNRPFGMIQYPNKANPVIVSFGDSFEIIVNSSVETEEWILILTNGTFSIDLDIQNTVFEEDFWYLSAEPSLQIEGLYDLQLNCSEGDDYQTHAVKIVEGKTYPITFVQVSDLHFPTYIGTGINTTEVNLLLFEEIRNLNPDFILCTGDLTQGPQWWFLNPETGRPMSGESQLRLGLWALDLLNLPVFYIHGNHEFSQTSLVPDNLEDVWYKYLGPIRYQNFTYLDWSFFGFGSSFEGLSQKEMDDFNSMVEKECNNANVFYYHSNFAKQSASVISKYPIEVAISGHSHDRGIYFSGETLYVDAGALMYGDYSVYSIEDETTINVNGDSYDFDPLILYTPERTESYSFLAVILTAFILLPIFRRKMKKI